MVASIKWHEYEEYLDMHRDFETKQNEDAIR